jgi:GNAT superfamily N-acetyltransferase
MSISIRTIEQGDFERLLELFKEFADFEKLPHKMTNGLKKMRDEMQYLNGFVAVNADKIIVGYTTFFFCYFTWSGKSLYMDDLYVQLEHREKGIGTQLLDAVIVYAKASQCHKLRWQVSNWNKSVIHFYEKKGASIDNIEQNCDLILN